MIFNRSNVYTYLWVLIYYRKNSFYCIDLCMVSLWEMVLRNAQIFYILLYRISLIKLLPWIKTGLEWKTGKCLITRRQALNNGRGLQHRALNCSLIWRLINLSIWTIWPHSVNIGYTSSRITSTSGPQGFELRVVYINWSIGIIKVKVTGSSKLRKWPISKSISFAMCWDILDIVDDYDITRQYSNFHLARFFISASYDLYIGLQPRPRMHF